jgi:hypothetical protein
MGESAEGEDQHGKQNGGRNRQIFQLPRLNNAKQRHDHDSTKEHPCKFERYRRRGGGEYSKFGTLKPVHSGNNQDERTHQIQS